MDAYLNYWPSSLEVNKKEKKEERRDYSQTIKEKNQSSFIASLKRQAE